MYRRLLYGMKVEWIDKNPISFRRVIKMAGKIFYRERVKGQEGARAPRFRVVAVSGTDLKIYSDHLRKKELQQLAKATSAELVLLERDEKSKQPKLTKKSKKKNV